MKVKTEVRKNIRFIRPSASMLNISNKYVLQEQCELSRGETVLAIDLSEVEYVDSTILGLFLFKSQNFAREGNKLVIFSANDTVIGLIEMTRLTYFIEIREDRKDVMRDFAENT